YSFSILPKEVTADWSMSPSRYLYNGEVQVPMVVVRDIFGSILPSTVLGGATDANEGGYPATVTIDDPNYRLERSSATTRFYIDALPVDVIWESLEILYTGSPISPTATATGINGFDIPLTYTGSGVESSNIAYTVQASTLNPNYLLQDALQDFWIRPRPVEVEWLLPSAGFTYNTRDQSVNVRAQYTRPDETFAPLNIRIEGNVAFRNAGTYNVVAVMPADINNFVLEDDGENTVELTINKAKPNILVGNRRPVFTYSGENFAIVTDINADVEPIFTMGESTVSNAFREAGVYTVQIATRETDNYIAAAPVTVILTINDIYFQTSESTPYTASIVYQRGNNPNAVLKVRQISPYDIPRYDNQWGRSVKTAFEVTFDIDGESTSLKGRSELTFKLPEKYAKEETIKIISYSNGAYREQEVENKNGYVTIKLAQDGVYAIVETNDNYIFIWWTAIAVIFFAIIIGTVIHFSQKNKIIG
ncbi:MAG: MBG domain-containing protein, partial [Clostridia bacterium]